MSTHIGASACPIHVLWPQLSEGRNQAGAISPGSIAESALAWLRYGLSARSTPHAMEFTLHSLRRGSARAIMDKGGDLSILLNAGSWKSSAFKSYLDMEGLESRVVGATMNALVDLDDEEEAAESQGAVGGA